MIDFAPAARAATRLPAPDSTAALLSLLPDTSTPRDAFSSSPAALMAALPDAVWRASEMGASKARATPSGHRALDRELPNGGWPASVLIELLLSQNGIGELRLLAPTLSALTRAGKTVVLLAPPHIPFAPALAELGLDLAHVLLIQTDKPMDRVWAVEQTLKSASFGALLCWLPQARPDHLRRLQLAAGSGDGLCFVFRPAAVQRESSPAPLRIVCRAGSCGGIAVDIVKRRGPVFGQPILLPLQVPPALDKPFGRRSAAPDVPAIMPADAPVIARAAVFSPSNAVADHAVDRPEPAATAARYRPAVAV